jgi:7-cyano-7-deazaguanine synthase
MSGGSAMAQTHEVAAILVSGGLDSAVLCAEMARDVDRVYPLYVRAGLSWEAAEIHWLGKLLDVNPYRRCMPLTFLGLPVTDLYGNHWSTTGRGVPGYDTALDSNYLPGRNLLLLSKAAVFCAMRGITRIAMAPLGDNPFPDGRPEFFRSFERVVEVGLEARLSIEIPFRDLEKPEVIQRGRELPLGLTFSCIHPQGVAHCGDCTKCAERHRAFVESGVPDPTGYVRAPATTS